MARVRIELGLNPRIFEPLDCRPTWVSAIISPSRTDANSIISTARTDPKSIISTAQTVAALTITLALNPKRYEMSTANPTPKP